MKKENHSQGHQANLC